MMDSRGGWRLTLFIFLSWGDELNADRRETLVFAGLLECLDFCCFLSILFDHFFNFIRDACLCRLIA